MLRGYLVQAPESSDKIKFVWNESVFCGIFLLRVSISIYMVNLSNNSQMERLVTLSFIIWIQLKFLSSKEIENILLSRSTICGSGPKNCGDAHKLTSSSGIWLWNTGGSEWNIFTVILFIHQIFSTFVIFICITNSDLWISNRIFVSAQNKVKSCSIHTLNKSIYTSSF